MKATYNVVLDLMKANKTANIEIKQNDDKSRFIAFTILEDGKLFDLSDIDHVAVMAINPNELRIYSEAEIVNGKVVWMVTDSITQVNGRTVVELQFYSKEGQMIQTFDFYITVYAQLFDENSLMRTDDLEGFHSFLSRAQAAAYAAEFVKNTFERENGEISKLKNEYVETLDEYSQWINKFKSDVAAGLYNGARGQQGENGTSGYVAEGLGVIGFDLVDGDLICHYYEDEPPFALDDNGNLVLSY